MTYLELATHIIKHFTREQKNSEVTICDRDFEYFKAGLNFEDPKVSSVLDPEHPFFVILD
jgi:hypothetical protein